MSFYPSSIPRCQHIKVNGTQCGSPALRRRRFCFFHHQWRQERISLGAEHARQARSFDLPVLEDANSIQIALMQIMRLILRGQIDPKSVGLLLYALQTASVNLRHTEFEPRPQTHIVLDPRDVSETPLGERQWDPDDFEEEEELDEDEDSEGEEESEDEEEAGQESAGSEESIAVANDKRRTTNDGKSATSDRKPPASIQASAAAHGTRAAAANDQRPSLARPELSEGTNDRQGARWFAPDGTPVTGSKLDELRMLTQFIDYLAPLDEKNDDGA
jgi:hypothetical protein